MPHISPELQKAIDNIETCKRVVSEKIADSGRKSSLLALVDNLEETLILAPASTRIDYHGAFPGGLIDHSLRVLKTMSALNRAYEANLSTDNLVITGLFHDVGKCGNGERSYYLPKSSDWHNKQGIMYEINPDMINQPVSLRSLYLLQKFGVKLSEDEHYAISTIKDRTRSTEDSQLGSNEPMLAVILQQAVRVACIKASGKSSLLG